MKNCNKCGAEIDDNTLFCPTCGAMQNGSEEFTPYDPGIIEESAPAPSSSSGTGVGGGSRFGSSSTSAPSTSGTGVGGGSRFGSSSGSTGGTRFGGSTTSTTSTGSSYSGGSSYSAPKEYRRSFFVALLSFCFWPLGLLMWLIWKDSKPGKAMSAAKGVWSLISLYPGVGVVVWLIRRKSNPEIAKHCLMISIIEIALMVLGAMVGAF